jgi:hypothetical protein
MVRVEELKEMRVGFLTPRAVFTIMLEPDITSDQTEALCEVGYICKKQNEFNSDCSLFLLFCY